MAYSLSFRRGSPTQVIAACIVLLVGVFGAAPAHAAGTITVDRTDDTAAAAAAVCSPAANDCSLRGAVVYANNNPGTTITVPPGSYMLTITGSNENLSATGDLDVRASNTVIQGAGPSSTFIGWDLSVAEANRDRVLELNPTLSGGFNFTLTGVSVINGRDQTGAGGGGMISGSAAGTNGLVTLSNCGFYDNRVTVAGSSPVGGAVGHAGGSLSITNCTFDGNQSRGSGGALYFDPFGSGSLSIANSVFTNNSSQASGGAIRTGVVTAASAPASISNSVFSSNRAQGVNGTGGAIYNESGNLNVTTSTFTNNQVTNANGGRGGAIGSSDSAGKTVNVQFSRLVGNSAATAANGMAVYGGIGSTMNVNDNWWGSNSGPGANGVAGAVIADRWLQLRNSANPAGLPVGETSTLTADLLGRNTGGPIEASSLVGLAPFPNPAAPVFNNAIKGTLSNTATQFVNGMATATFTITACGNGGADVSADSQVVQAAVEGLCPDLVVSKAHSTSFTQGDTGDLYTLTVRNIGTLASSGVVSVIDTLPGGLVATALTGDGWSCTLATLTCSRSDPLAINANFPAITLAVNVAINASPTVTNTASVFGIGESDTNNNGASDPTAITQLVRSVVVSPRSLNLLEGGTPKTYAVSLGVEPTADVVIRIATDGQTTVSPTTLTFTRANWNVPQTVVVAAVDNTVAEPTRTSTITHSATSADGTYNGIAIPNVVATIIDNDSAQIFKVYVPLAQAR